MGSMAFRKLQIHRGVNTGGVIDSRADRWRGARGSIDLAKPPHTPIG